MATDLTFEYRERGDPVNPPVVVFVGTGASCNNALIDDALADRGFYVLTFNARDVVGSALETAWDGDRDTAAWNEEMAKAFNPGGGGGDYVAPYSMADQADDYAR